MPIVVPAGAGVAVAFNLTGRLIMNDGITPVVGATVLIRPNTPAMPDPAANNVYVEDVDVETDGNGEFSTPLVGLDDVYYTVMSGDNRTNFRAGPFAAPLDGATIDLADIIALVPSPILPLDATALRAEFAAADNALEAELRAEFLSTALMLTPDQFGALGVGNDSAVLTSWLTNVLGEGAHGYMKPRDGGYILGDPVVVTDSNDLRYALTGAGTGVTQLWVPPSNTDGGILIDATGTPRDAEVIVRDFTIVTQGQGAGTGFEFAMTAGGAQHKRSISLTNVEVCGEDITEDCFEFGIRLPATWRPLLNNVIVNGPWGPGVDDDQTDGSPLYVQDTALVLDDAYAWEVHQSYFWSAQTAISDIGTDAEGGRLINSHLVGVLTGLDRFRSTSQPGLQVRGCHINYRNQGLHLDGAKVSWITGCHIYNQDDTNEFTGNPIDIHLENAEEINVHHNFFKYPGHTDRTHIWVDGSTLARRVKVNNNIFAATGQYGVLISTGATETKVEDNDNFGGTYTQLIQDNSGSAVIRDSNGSSMRLESQNNGSGANPVHEFYRDSASPASADNLGRISIAGNDSAGNKTEYAAIQTQINDATDGSEDGALSAWVQTAGTLTKLATFQAVGVGDSTAMLLLVSRGGVLAVERVVLGAADSAGTGFRTLRVPNS